jgi:hypothetical protein
VVLIKKKKKSKKVVKHAEPNPRELALDKEPPASVESAQVGGRDGQESPRNDETEAIGGNGQDQPQSPVGSYHSPSYGVDEDEFRNVWGGDEESR